MDHWVGCVFSLHFQRKFYPPTLANRLKARKKQSAGVEVTKDIRFPRRENDREKLRTLFLIYG